MYSSRLHILKLIAIKKYLLKQRMKAGDTRIGFYNSGRILEIHGNGLRQKIIFIKRMKFAFSTGGVLFYHNNGERTIFDTTVAQQGMDAVKEQLYNPLKNLAFGGVLRGKNFIHAGTTEGVYANTDFKGWKLKSKSPAKQHSLALTLLT